MAASLESLGPLQARQRSPQPPPVQERVTVTGYQVGIPDGEELLLYRALRSSEAAGQHYREGNQVVLILLPLLPLWHR